MRDVPRRQVCGEWIHPSTQNSDSGMSQLEQMTRLDDRRHLCPANRKEWRVSSGYRSMRLRVLGNGYRQRGTWIGVPPAVLPLSIPIRRNLDAVHHNDTQRLEQNPEPGASRQDPSENKPPLNEQTHSLTQQSIIIPRLCTQPAPNARNGDDTTVATKADTARMTPPPPCTSGGCGFRGCAGSSGRCSGNSSGQHTATP